MTYYKILFLCIIYINVLILIRGEMYDNINGWMGIWFKLKYLNYIGIVRYYN